MSHAEVKPSFGNANLTSSSSFRPSSKKAFFSLFSSGKGTHSSVHSEIEKGSFTEESDHVMVQRTIQVSSAESPVPRPVGSGTMKF